MATEVATVPSAPKRLVLFYHDVVAEMKRVTWPDRPQVQSLSIGVIALSLFIGLVIWLMDLALQAIMVRGIPAIFGA
jgi:preprotein translocase subunit SecE